MPNCSLPTPESQWERTFGSNVNKFVRNASILIPQIVKYFCKKQPFIYVLGKIIIMKCGKKIQ